MNLYLDASVIIAVLLEETSSGAIDAFLRSSPASLTTSDFGIGECSAALVGLVGMSRKSPVQTNVLLAGLDRWIERSFDTFPIRTSDIDKATLLVRRFDLGLRLPDAIHVVTADRLDTTLITLDRRMAAAANALGIRCINPADDPADRKT